MRARMGQHRIRHGPHHPSCLAHRDNVQIQCTSRVALAPRPAGLRLDHLEPREQVGGVGFRGGWLGSQKRDSVDVEGLAGRGDRFSVKPARQGAQPEPRQRVQVPRSPASCFERARTVRRRKIRADPHDNHPQRIRPSGLQFNEKLR